MRADTAIDALTHDGRARSEPVIARPVDLRVWMSFLCPALKAVLKRERVALRRACCVEWILEGILENLDSENHNMYFTIILLLYFMRLRNDEQKHEIENVWAAQQRQRPTRGRKT